MSKAHGNFDEQLYDLLLRMSNAGMVNAARGISSMVGENLTVSDPVVHLVPITSIPELLGGPEKEAVGVYLRAEGKLSGQIMMVIPYEKALELVDLIMGDPAGSTQHLGSLERSALAELGNLSGTFFLNAIAAITGQETRPSPPAVMVDMVGSILDILLATWDGLSETVMLIQARFLNGEREIEADFWMIPDRNTLDSVLKKDTGSHGAGKNT